MRERRSGFLTACASAVKKIIRQLQYPLRRRIIIPERAQGIGIKKPCEATMLPRRDGHARVSRFSKVKNHRIVNGLIPSPEIKFFIRTKIGDDVQVGFFKPSLFFCFPKRGVQTLLSHFEMAFRKVPIVPPAIE